MEEINSARATDNSPKRRPRSRRRRLPPLRALWLWALFHAALTLSWLIPPPRAAARAAARAAELSRVAAISTAAAISQAELDQRAPLAPQEAARFSTGAHDRTLRRVYQATGLATQGGRKDGTIRHIARIAGRSERHVKRCHRELQARGIMRTTERKFDRQWFGPRAQKYRRYNKTNAYRFLLRERQLQLFFKNVPPCRKNLKANKTESPQKLSVMWKSKRRTRPDDHPAAFRAAWEARRRSNHPPQIRERYEAQGVVWAGMRQWRQNRGPKWLETFERAKEASVGVGFASDAEWFGYVCDRAERMGMSSRRRKKLEAMRAEQDAAERRERARTAAAAISWAELDQAELAAAYVAQLPPPAASISTAELDQAELARAARDAAELEAWTAEHTAAISHTAELAAAKAQAGGGDYSTVRQPSKRPAAAELPQEPRVAAISAAEQPQAEEPRAAAISADEECPLCEGRMRRVVGGRIVICKCAPPGDQWRVYGG